MGSIVFKDLLLFFVGAILAVFGRLQHRRVSQIRSDLEAGIVEELVGTFVGPTQPLGERILERFGDVYALVPIRVSGKRLYVCKIHYEAFGARNGQVSKVEFLPYSQIVTTLESQWLGV